jgi:hypothetical protein
MTDTAHTDTATATNADGVEHPARSSAAERLGGPSSTDRESATTDSATTDSATTDSATTDSATGANDRGDSGRDNGRDNGNANLIAHDKAESYRGRWNELKGEFVDEPRSAVRGANELVGEVLDELEQLFRRQRDELERGLDSDDASTEDLRQALGNYRSFFDRLLSF